MAAKKTGQKTADPKATEATEATEPTEPTELAGPIDYDLEAGAIPNDGDLCETVVFDPKKGQATAGPTCIYDGARGVFFKAPERDATGMVVSCETGQRRDNYKAERIRNVVTFTVIEAGHDPAPPAESVIDHRKAMDHASARPPEHNIPTDVLRD